MEDFFMALSRAALNRLHSSDPLNSMAKSFLSTPVPNHYQQDLELITFRLSNIS